MHQHRNRRNMSSNRNQIMNEEQEPEPEQPIEFVLDDDVPSIPLQRHRSLLASLMQITGESGAEISIALVRDAAIQAMNRNYRGVDSPTDVLSFCMREGETIGQAHLLGDIAISFDTASQQAQDAQHDLADELDELLFHGFLHLLGYDHESDADRMQWLEAERNLQSQLADCELAFIPRGLLQYENRSFIEGGEQSASPTREDRHDRTH